MRTLSTCMALSVSFVLAVQAEDAFAKVAYKEVAVTNGGTVQGKINFSGAVPNQPTELIGKDNEVCGNGEVTPNPVQVGGGGELAGVVVFIEDISSGKAWSTTEFTLNQTKCTFEPYLQVMKKGAELTIKNSDPVLHNVHPYEIIGDKRRTIFNMAQPDLNQVNTKKIKTRRSQVVQLACDAHNWMSGWIYVQENPYNAVVGADGSFSIGDVPPGDYVLKAWHPVLGVQEQAFSVDANGVAQVAFDFSAQ